jgi:hypothetical protein
MEQMVWRGYIAQEMVDGWTLEQVEMLRELLDGMVNATFEAVEEEVINTNPLVRLKLEA